MRHQTGWPQEEHRLFLDAIRRWGSVDAERDGRSGHIRRTGVELTPHPELFNHGSPQGSGQNVLLLAR